MATPAIWEPGTAAGYHAVERLEGPRRGRRGGRRPADRAVPGRRGARAAVGMTSRRSASRSTRQAALGDRLVPVSWKGHIFPPRRRRRRLLRWSRTGSTGPQRAVARREGRARRWRCAARRASWAASTSRCSGTARRCSNPAPWRSWRAVHRDGLQDALFGFDDAVGPRASRSPVTGGAGRRGVRPRRDGVVARARATPSSGGDGAGRRNGCRDRSPPSSGSPR